MTFKNTLFLYASIFLLLAIVVGFVISSSSDAIEKFDREDKGIESLNTLQERQKWIGRIDAVGTERAYEEFKKMYASDRFKIQHTMAHVMGELLYEKKGIEGLTTCDSSFAFGCYHSFFGRAISEEGMDAIPKLDKACVKKYGPGGTGCLHGIGHGIIEYLGHDKLVTALEACRLTTQVNPLFGCTSGVFMEHNIPIIISAEKIQSKIREPNNENPYEPCNTIVPKEFRKSCYFEIGLWWKHVLDADFEKLGMLCKKIPEAEYRELCYLGVGTVVAPTSNFEAEKAIRLCEEMPDPRPILLCRAGASWVFFAVPEKRFLAQTVCKNPEQSDELYCLLKSDLFNGKDND
ncbi:hypothetical protein IIA95_04175 [Patescibacteria group bacterium]|nr:hypothetical protein [Patescibacteria group bacterium]